MEYYCVKMQIEHFQAREQRRSVPRSLECDENVIVYWNVVKIIYPHTSLSKLIRATSQSI